MNESWWWTKNWYPDSSIGVVQARKTKVAMLNKTVVHRLMVVHKDCTRKIPNIWKNSWEVYLHQLVNWTTCYYSKAWVSPGSSLYLLTKYLTANNSYRRWNMITPITVVKVILEPSDFLKYRGSYKLNNRSKSILYKHPIRTR